MNTFLYLLAFLCPMVLSAQIDWCLYYRLRKIYKPECKFYDITRERPGVRELARKLSAPFPEDITPSPPTVPVMAVTTLNPFISVTRPPVCTAFKRFCTKSSLCNAGHERCVDMVSFRECCASVEKECPKPFSFGFQCIVTRPTNWCNYDFECSNAPNKKCCATGCNYNVCL